MQETTDKDRRKRVLIIEEQPVAAFGMWRLIESTSALEVVAVVRNSTEALVAMVTSSPSVVIMEMLVEERNALNLLRSIRRLNPETRVLVVSMLPESIYAERALRAGALGYLEKKDSLDNILSALSNISRNEIYMSPYMRQKLLRRMMPDDVFMPELTDTLDDFELSIFELLGKDRAAEDISRRLDIGAGTAAVCIRKIKRKLGISSECQFHEAARLWIQTHHC